MGYADKDFKGRKDEELGERAEAAFERLAKSKGVEFDKKGFEGSPLTNFWQLPAWFRQMPDYVCHKKRKFLVECKGCGGYVLKIKKQSIESLNWWNQSINTWVFLYDSSTDRYAFLHVAALEKIAETSPVKYFKEYNPKPYYEIRTTKFKWHPVPKEEDNGDTAKARLARLRRARPARRAYPRRFRLQRR